MVRRRGAAAGGEPAFERVADLARLEALAAEWDALLERSSCNRAFGSPRWYLTWCRLEPRWRPHAVIARRGAKLAGVLALVRPVAGGAASFPGDLSDSNDAVVARGDLAVCAGLLRTALADGPPLDLHPVRADSNLALGLRELAPSRDPVGFLAAEGALRCSYAELAGGYDAYLATRTSKFRNNLRRSRRRAAERGFEVRELEPASFAPSRLPEVFLELHLDRFPQSCFAAARERSFAERALPGLFADRALRAFAVFDGGRMIGLSLCAVGDRSLGVWNGGLLPEALECGAGKLLIDAAIRRSCAEGLEELDFLRGDEPYKAEWSTGARTIGRLDAGRAGPRRPGIS